MEKNEFNYLASNVQAADILIVSIHFKMDQISLFNRG